ncbi:MAG TPA: GNVR domain-containing protein [Anaerolineae bacterium]|nr:GNVR domain-containing protein [Anaerolineae bacterium]
MEEEIDLRVYIDILLRWWWLIVLGAVLTGGVAFTLGLLRPPTYEAVAGVVSLRSRADISLGSSFQSVTDEDLSSLGSLSAAAMIERNKLRLNTLAGMVRNGAVAEQVVAELQTQLDEEEREPAVLQQLVRGEVMEIEGGGSSDTIQIIVSHRDPEKAALIANAWAKAYAAYVNAIYGDATFMPFEDIRVQMATARTEYDTAQETLLTFLSENDQVFELQRQIEEEELIIANLRTARRTAISAVVDKEVQIKQQLIQAYMQDDIDNRLFAFNKGQEANRKILGTWIDAEVANRVGAIERDRNMRLKLFETSVAAEADAKLKVFDAQHAALLTTLDETYARKLRLQSLLPDARLMREQLIVGGDAAARSNGLALLAFKSQVFSTDVGLPFERLDLQATSIDALNPDRNADEQIADLDALIAAMEAELDIVNAEIQTQSESLLQGEGYAFLDTLTPELWSSSWDSVLTDTAIVSGNLTAYIVERYSDLFDLGPIALSATAVATDTPLFAEIQVLYPELFAKDPWKELAETIPKETEVGTLANQMAQELLDMQGLEELLSYSTLEAPLSQEIARRESSVRELKADIARLEQVKIDLQQRRDLAWKAYSTLLSTSQEVDIAAASRSSEVRFASPALPPRNPTGPGKLLMTAVGMAVGFMLGVFGAFLFDYVGMESTPYYMWQQLRRIGQIPRSVWGAPLPETSASVVAVRDAPPSDEENSAS